MHLEKDHYAIKFLKDVWGPLGSNHITLKSKHRLRLNSSWNIVQPSIEMIGLCAIVVFYPPPSLEDLFRKFVLTTEYRPWVRFSCRRTPISVGYNLGEFFCITWTTQLSLSTYSGCYAFFYFENCTILFVGTCWNMFYLFEVLNHRIL